MLVMLCAPACTCHRAPPHREELQQGPALLLAFAKPSVILQPSLALQPQCTGKLCPPGFPTCTSWVLALPLADLGLNPTASLACYWGAEVLPGVLWCCRCFRSSLGLLSFSMCAGCVVLLLLSILKPVQCFSEQVAQTP